MTTSHRLFIGLWPESALRRQIHQYQLSLLQLYSELSTARIIPEANLHLTLCFLGDVESQNIPALVGALGNLEQDSFELRLQGLGYFKGARILWQGLAAPGPPLMQLQKAVTEVVQKLLPTISGGENFIPHVSLFKSDIDISEAEAGGAMTWPIQSFALIESKSTDSGVEYQLLERFDLLKAG